jgi:primosomal protein N' (replication factor Y) (superfamily II helicase)
MRRVSPVRFFDEAMLHLARWMSERYVAPLATVLGVLSPPRVASEEIDLGQTGTVEGSPQREPSVPATLADYRGGAELLEAIGGGSGAFILRPAPEDEQAAAVHAVGACLASGRRAIVVVPEAAPVPATATALRTAFGDRVCLYLGGDKRQRYRDWLAVRDGRYDVVVGTRPAVFAPLRDVGLVYVSRESHAAHREDRAPYHHVRDVALQRTRLSVGTCVLAALCPTGEAAALGIPVVTPADRRWPVVEVVRPGPEGRAPRLVQALRSVRRAFIYAPVPGYGVAGICRTCGRPAACASCGGLLRAESGQVRCIVCASIGVCAVCGGTTFGIRRGGAEHVEGWAARSASVPVARPPRPRLPRSAGEIVVGGAELVRDLGPGALDLVAVLDADAAARWPRVSARWPSGWRRSVGPGRRAVPSFRARTRRIPPSRRSSGGTPIGSSRASGSNAPRPDSRSAPPCSA